MEFVAGDEKQSMKDRGITFEAVLSARALDFIENPRHPGQKILIVNIDNYAIAAPCKPLAENRWLLITAYPSRKHTKQYL